MPPVRTVSANATYRLVFAVGLVVASVVVGPSTAGAEAAPSCADGQSPHFSLGIADLKVALGEAMGDPLECEHASSATGDTLQQTTTGLAMYRQSTNSPEFTDGWTHWTLSDAGLVSSTGDFDPATLASPATPPVWGGPPANSGGPVATISSRTSGAPQSPAATSATGPDGTGAPLGGTGTQTSGGPGGQPAATGVQPTAPTTQPAGGIGQPVATGSQPVGSIGQSAGTSVPGDGGAPAATAAPSINSGPADTHAASVQSLAPPPRASLTRCVDVGNGACFRTVPELADTVTLLAHSGTAAPLLRSAAKAGFVLHYSDLPADVLGMFRPGGHDVMLSTVLRSYPTLDRGPVLAHELQHVADWLAQGAALETPAGCYATEANAFRTESSTWLELQGGHLTPPANDLERELNMINRAITTDPAGFANQLKIVYHAECSPG